MVLLEVCVDSVMSIQNAVDGDADRIELCSALSEGGLTPSVGLFQAAKRITSGRKTKIFVMIRIRGGNFNYSDEELNAMIEDVKYFKEQNADGIVFGALTAENKIDTDACIKILNAWDRCKPATFHRAFDEAHVQDLIENTKIVSDLGFSRLLTSGLEATAVAGIENIRTIAGNAGKMIVMPGSGVSIKNAAEILSKTGCKEIHGSFRSERDISTRLSIGGSKLYTCDRERVKEVVKALKDF